MNVRDLKVEGEVVETTVRTLSESEMASVIGSGPIMIVEEKTPSCSCINGCWQADDCED